LRRASTARLLGEFVVIAVGVLAALAVDAAVGFRTDRQDEVEYLQALRAEIRRDSIGFASYVAMRRDTVLLELFREIEAGPVRDTVGVLGRLRSATTPRTMPPNRTVFDEIVSTGSLRLIRDTEVRRAVAAYYEWYDHMQPLDDEIERYGTFEAGGAFSPHVDGILWTEIARVYRGTGSVPEAGPDEVMELRRTLEVRHSQADFTALVADPSVRSYIGRVAEGYALQQILYSVALDQAERVLELISSSY